MCLSEQPKKNFLLWAVHRFPFEMYFKNQHINRHGVGFGFQSIRFCCKIWKMHTHTLLIYFESLMIFHSICSMWNANASQHKTLYTFDTLMVGLEMAAFTKTKIYSYNASMLNRYIPSIYAKWNIIHFLLWNATTLITAAAACVVVAITTDIHGQYDKYPSKLTLQIAHPYNDGISFLICLMCVFVFPWIHFVCILCVWNFSMTSTSTSFRIVHALYNK